MSFYEKNFKNRVYYKSNIFDSSDITHAFTTSLGGVSHGIIEGLNFGFRTKDDTASVNENYRLLSLDLNITLDSAVLAKQTHTDNIRLVTRADAGKGITKESDIEDTDGLITDIKGMALIIFSADCTPILLYDKSKKVVAAVHSGWRGSVKRISEKCVRLMQDAYGSKPNDILVAIGPSIGPCCFEFGLEATDIFEKEYLTPTKDNKYLVDLWRYNRDVLLQSGIPIENIESSHICTVCNSDKFYSYRCHKDRTGRQIAVIMLKD